MWNQFIAKKIINFTLLTNIKIYNLDEVLSEFMI